MRSSRETKLARLSTCCLLVGLGGLLAGCELVGGIEERSLLSGAAGSPATGADCGGDAVPAQTATDGAPFCIDRYEASLGPSSRAQSIAGVLPWVSITQTDAQAACALADKRLCTSAEWQSACAGNPPTTYPYGDAFEQERCNDAYVGHDEVIATGSLPGCEGSIGGLFDMSGNAAEWTASCDGNDYCQVKGGHFNDVDELVCAEHITEHASDRRDYVGFRCCRGRELR